MVEDDDDDNALRPHTLPALTLPSRWALAVRVSGNGDDDLIMNLHVGGRAYSLGVGKDVPYYKEIYNGGRWVLLGADDTECTLFSSYGPDSNTFSDLESLADEFSNQWLSNQVGKAFVLFLVLIFVQLF